jgi:peptidoglycan/LPS O-acetylase OafA/YrhL
MMIDQPSPILKAPNEQPKPSMSTRRKSGYLPSLDGWRTIAILGVLLAHEEGSFPLRVLERLHKEGGLGVFFFAISGVLITWRILEDEKASGRFDIKGFYLRRLFRIQPAAWLYLAVLAVLMLSGAVDQRWSLWSGAMLMVRNFQFHDLDLGASLRQAGSRVIIGRSRSKSISIYCFRCSSFSLNALAPLSS